MKDFFKMFLASLLALVLVVGGGVLAFMVVVAAVSASGAKAKVPKGAMLVLDVTTPISDKPADKSARDLLNDAAFAGGGQTVNLRSVTRAIQKAAKDDRIKGIYLTGNVVRSGYSSGWAALEEVRLNLEEFKKSGKKVIAYNQAYDEATYYLASVADEVIVNPFGLMEVKGFAAQLMFFADLFEKYGIGVQVSRVGKYKSAVEPFLLDHMSEANREQVTKLLGDVWQKYIADIAAARKLQPADIQRLADERGILKADEMKQLGLADTVAYFDDVLGALKKITGDGPDERTFKQVRLGEYIEAIEPSEKTGGANRVAIVYAEGDIIDGNDRTQVGGDYVARLLRKAREDDKVKAVVLRVNSPGGSASASEVIQREVRLIKGKKPIIISMGTVAASGGYWISAYGDRIFAEPTTITGSIGVFGLFPNVQKLVNNFGLNIETVKTGKLADLGSLYRPKTDEELALLQHQVDWVYNEFLAKVSEGRKMPVTQVQEIAQGRVWSGSEALKLGLVDELGGLEAALKHAAAQAKLGDDYAVQVYQLRKTPMQQLLSAFGGDPEEEQLAREGAVMLGVRQVWTDLRALSALNDPRGVYARLPYNVNPH